MQTTETQIMPNRFSFIRKRLRQKVIANLLMLLVLIPVGFLIAMPFMWMLTASLKVRGHMAEGPMLFPATFDFSNYVTAWQGAPFGRYYINTIIVAFGIVVSRLLIGSMAAYAFAILKFKGRDFLFMAYMTTMMIPFYAIVIPLYLIIRDFSWFNTYQALIVPRMVDAFGILLLRQAFIAVPKDYIDAARIDGCTHWQILWKQIIPLSLPTILTVSIFNFMFAWNDFMWPFLVANDTHMRVIQTGLQAFSGRYLTEWTYWMAGTVMTTIPPIVLFLFAQKKFISGLSRTGMKA
jgi:multiple sugar transport system permease protein